MAAGLAINAGSQATDVGVGVGEACLGWGLLSEQPDAGLYLEASPSFPITKGFFTLPSSPSIGLRGKKCHTVVLNLCPLINQISHFAQKCFVNGHEVNYLVLG